MTLYENVIPYIVAIEKSVEQKNWLAAMTGALTIIDICSSLRAANGRTSGKKYECWFEQYCTTFKMTVYKKTPPPTVRNIETMTQWMSEQRKLSRGTENIVQSHVYFNGLNAYALRCSLLHNGTGELTDQSVYKNAISNKEIDVYDSKKPLKTLGINKIILDMSNPDKVLDRYADTLYLNPKIFCEEVIDSVYKWIEDYKDDNTTINNSKRMIRVIESNE